MGYLLPFCPLQPSQQVSPAWTETQWTGACISVQVGYKFGNLTNRDHLWQQNNIPWTSQLSADVTLLGESMSIIQTTWCYSLHLKLGEDLSQSPLNVGPRVWEAKKAEENDCTVFRQEDFTSQIILPLIWVKMQKWRCQKMICAIIINLLFPLLPFYKTLKLKLLLALTLRSKQIFPWLSEKEICSLFGTITTKTTKWNKTRKPEATHTITDSLFLLFWASSHCFSCAATLHNLNLIPPPQNTVTTDLTFLQL